jgi:hypothetical protein
MPDKGLRNLPRIFKKTTPRDSETAEQEDIQTFSRFKATFYLDIEDIKAIDDLQATEMQMTGKKPEKSQIVSRAIKAYKQQAV